jgi:ubiquinone/menaquinone biosynthesis C-methylase UbiE
MNIKSGWTAAAAGVLPIFLLHGAATGLAVAQTPASHQHGFGDAAKWSQTFDDPARDTWQKPHEVITALKLAPGQVVADIGSGTGYFAMRLAHFVPQGRVYGVDTEPGMVRYLAQRASQAGLSNLLAIAGKPEDPMLPEAVDLVLIVDTYHHISERGAYFRKLRAMLKPGGRVAIIDFNAASKVGPPVTERIPADQVKAELAAVGYRAVAEPAFLPNQYFLIFQQVAQ